MHLSMFASNWSFSPKCSPKLRLQLFLCTFIENENAFSSSERTLTRLSRLCFKNLFMSYVWGKTNMGDIVLQMWVLSSHTDSRTTSTAHAYQKYWMGDEWMPWHHFSASFPILHMCLKLKAIKTLHEAECGRTQAHLELFTEGKQITPLWKLYLKEEEKNPI